MNIGYAESLARHVHDEYVETLPVDPIQIALDMGIQAEEIPFVFDPEYSSYSGLAFIDPDTNKRVIQINAVENQNRKRFTAAHELGHHVLNHTLSGHMFRDKLKSQDVPYQRDIREIEANRFAAELLMPATRVEAAFSTNHSMSEIAQYFGVSEEAMFYRLKSLGLVR